MAVVFFHYLSSPLSFSPLLQSSRLLNSSRYRISASSTPSDQMAEGPKKTIRRSTFMEFPYLSDPHRNLMVDLASAVETRLDSQLLPCTLPENVRYFESQSGTSHATLYLRSGISSSPVISLFMF